VSDLVKKGVFITFEGPDGSGKSTQQRLLGLFLKKKGLDVVLSREPGGSPLAEKIRKMLLNNKNVNLTSKAELLLFEAARQQHVCETILPALQRGKVVISDRFFDSSSAYQGFGRGIKPTEVEWLNNFAVSGVNPDLTLLFDLDQTRGLKRAKSRTGKKDRLENAGVDFHKKVRRAFLELAKKNPIRIKVVKVDKKSTGEILEEVLAYLKPVFGKKGYVI
jgi:dTMP kinase